MANVTRQTPETTGQPVPRTHPLLGLRDEVDRLFESFLNAPMSRSLLELDPFRRLGTAFRLSGELAPEVDVKETDDRIEITAELPGLDQQDVELTVREGMLTLSGEKKVERKEEKADYHLSERHYGSFTRSFRLPEAADEEGITAEFTKGVLTIAVPKKPEAVSKAKKIDIATH